ncbi:hypothetical protein K438DRAFT_1816192, partial [Mycena galopus ATCC 62051]
LLGQVSATFNMPQFNLAQTSPLQAAPELFGVLGSNLRCSSLPRWPLPDRQGPQPKAASKSS